jgi:hypothetical protein
MSAENMPNRMSENISKICQIECHKICQIESQKIYQIICQKMSDRMPEDLSIRKCINVMVGITRRKIILNIFFLIKGLFPLSIDRKLASSASSAADIGQFWLGERRKSRILPKSRAEQQFNCTHYISKDCQRHCVL